MAVSRTHQGLAGVVREALTRVHASGEYADVLERWNLSAGAVDEIGLNGGT